MRLGERSKDRIPLALALAAFLIAVLGLTPLGEAATKAVQKVSSARETRAVNGIQASRTPRPNRLLPLDRDARFPASVMPAMPGARGPQGEVGNRGHEGVKGPDGGRAIVVHREEPFDLPATADRHTILSFNGLAPGSYVLTAMVELSSQAVVATRVECVFTRGDRVLGSGAAAVGTAPGGGTTMNVPMVGAVTSKGAETVRVQCAPEAAGRQIDVERAQASALRVESLEEIEVTQ